VSYFHNRTVCVPIMADGLGWVTLQLPTGELGWAGLVVDLRWVGLRNLDGQFWPCLP